MLLLTDPIFFAKNQPVSMPSCSHEMFCSVTVHSTSVLLLGPFYRSYMTTATTLRAVCWVAIDYIGEHVGEITKWSTSFSFAVSMSEPMVAQCSAPASEPANSAFLRLRAIGLMDRSTCRRTDQHPFSAFTNAANPSAPLRKSTGLVAIMTFTEPDGESQ